MRGLRAGLNRWPLPGGGMRGWVAGRRRAIAALLAATAALAVLSAAQRGNAAQAQTAVLVAARPLPSGHLLTAGDLTSRMLPTADLPAATLRSAGAAIGQLLSGGVTRGEPLTQARLIDPARLGPGQLAVPVHLADASAAGLLAAGDRIDLLTTTAGGHTSDAARGALVLAVPGGGLVLVATSSGAALALAGAARISAALSGPS